MTRKHGIFFSGSSILLIGLWAMSGYNSLVQQTKLVNAEWLELETAYEQRFALVPALVEVASPLATSNPEFFSSVTTARANFIGATNTNQKVDAIAELEHGLQRVQELIATQPELRSSEPIQNVSLELAVSQQFIKPEVSEYNLKVEAYNRSLNTFPLLLLTKLFQFPRLDPVDFVTTSSSK